MSVFLHIAFCATTTGGQSVCECLSSALEINAAACTMATANIGNIHG